MVATVEFDTLASLMTDAGYSDEDIHSARQDFYNAYPQLLSVPFSHAVSTIPNDAPVPLDWAESLLYSLGISAGPNELAVQYEDEE